ncbi:MAG: tetratricopeptide repeat protein [Cyanobacteriota bacterium]|nr:tetratricopeptide repeat protein [Cyanobacteriota bacterium]
MAARRLRFLLAAPMALSLGLAPVNPVQAMVPYVFTPRPGELEGAGLGIAQVAARLLRMGQAEEASRLAALTVQLMPNDPRGWVLLAEGQLRSRQSSKAALSLARAKALDPKNPGIWFAEGSLALRDGRPIDAVGLLKQGLRLESNNSGAYFDLGNAYIQLGNQGAALSAFERAAELRRDFWEAINNQGLVLFERGQREEALIRWRRVLRIKPGAAEPTLALASGLYSTARGPEARAEAVEMASQALAADPNYVLDSYQEDQLWGPRLRSAARVLLADPALRTSVERANANANPDESGTLE